MQFVGLTEGHVAQEAATGDGAGRGARNFVHQQVGRVLLEAGGHPDVVNAEESAPSKRQIHLECGRPMQCEQLWAFKSRRELSECQVRCAGFERRWSTGARGHCAPNINADVGADNKGAANALTASQQHYQLTFRTRLYGRRRNWLRAWCGVEAPPFGPRARA